MRFYSRVIVSVTIVALSFSIVSTVRTVQAGNLLPEEIRSVQQFLATDSKIYPEGKITGVLDLATTKALKRFQERYQLEVTGKYDELTSHVIAAHLRIEIGQRFSTNNLSPDFLSKTSNKMKAEFQVKNHCDTQALALYLEGYNTQVTALCKRLQKTYKDKSWNDILTKSEIQERIKYYGNLSKVNAVVTLRGGLLGQAVSHTVVVFEGKFYEINLPSIEVSSILNALAKQMGVSTKRLDKKLVVDIKKAHSDALARLNLGDIKTDKEFKKAMDKSLEAAKIKGKDAAIKANLSNMRAQAEIHYDTNRYTSLGYSGFCASKEYMSAQALMKSFGGLPDCHDSAQAYRITSILNNKKYWCIDSTGNSMELDKVTKGVLMCK